VFGSTGTIENSPAFQCRDRFGKCQVPQGRLKRNAVFSRPYRTDLRYRQTPALKTPGYFQNVPAGHDVFRRPKIEMRLCPAVADKIFVSW
jgi:hypothetical protein